jgi:predicted DNA-binding transcriptional regulator AlpA
VPITKFVTYPELPQYGVPKYSRKHLLDLQRRDQFPRALQLTPNRIGWSEISIQDWVASRPVARAVAEAPADAASAPVSPSGSPRILLRRRTPVPAE